MSGHTDLDLVDAYVAHGSVWKAGEALGIPGQAVHRRLARIGAIKPMRVFTDDERASVVAYYASTPSDDFSLDDLAKQLGRTRQFVCRQARALGLTNPRRKVSAKQREVLRRPRWQDKPHPRGALGLRHSDDTKRKVSEASKLAWITMKTFGIGNMSPEALQRSSDRTSQRMALQPAENAYSRSKGGRRDDLGGMYFRSAWEANYARYLNWLQSKGEIERWEYEPETFWFLAIKRGVRSYKPDFKIWERGKSYFVEVKGWMDDKSKTKLRRMKKYHPEIRVDVVDARQYASIKSKVSRMITGWEHS